MNPSFDPVGLLSGELELKHHQIASVVDLLGQGNTVPFIARYRKEVTGSLDETVIRTIQDRHSYLQELEKRRQAILEKIGEQGKLTPALEKQFLGCTTKAELEDCYRPYKSKRKTKASKAIEQGLKPLAELILSQGSGDPSVAGSRYVNAAKGVADSAVALAGARDIIAEQANENSEIRAIVREQFKRYGALVSAKVKKVEGRTKYEQYYEHRESVARIPSHRYLAIQRGEREKILRVKLEVDQERLINRMLWVLRYKKHSSFAAQLKSAVEDGYKRLIAPSIENEVRSELKERADQQAVSVFAENLSNLLLAPPMGTQSVIGIDPGIRTGCKCAVVDDTGRFLENITIFPDRKSQNAKRDLLRLIEKYNPFAIAVGNGTAGRETEKFVRKLVREWGQKKIATVLTSESGASIYSASDVAREEFPDLDLTVRGAISIARRLQDPLAELVKIEPKAIGVGQYQHDVQQTLLQKKLDDVVESCVNHVGVNLNTASAYLLRYVSGIGPSLAKKIVGFREQKGLFPNRRMLLKVPGLGPKAFEQAAGFLRVVSSDNPLDNSAVHPERYALVGKIAKNLGIQLALLMGNEKFISKIDPKDYVDKSVGQVTLIDILNELRKPGRDPRKSFEAPSFRDDIHSIEDLKLEMQLEGVVTNVTAFGAFVDIGVKQDGLVHISELADRYVDDPSTVVRVGQKLSVRVLDVDMVRQRISLSAKHKEQS